MSKFGYRAPSNEFAEQVGRLYCPGKAEKVILPRKFWYCPPAMAISCQANRSIMPQSAIPPNTEKSNLLWKLGAHFYNVNFTLFNEWWPHWDFQNAEDQFQRF